MHGPLQIRADDFVIFGPASFQFEGHNAKSRNLSKRDDFGGLVQCRAILGPSPKRNRRRFQSSFACRPKKPQTRFVESNHPKAPKIEDRIGSKNGARRAEISPNQSAPKPISQFEDSNAPNLVGSHRHKARFQVSRPHPSLNRRESGDEIHICASLSHFAPKLCR